jgi:RND family efflux transporter, MFP subunit
VIAEYDATLAFELAGTVVAMSSRVGDVVSKGQIVAQLDRRTIEASLKSIQAQYERGLAQKRLSDLQLQRATELLTSGAISQYQFDEAQLNADANTATVQALLADIELITVNQTNTELRSPFDGVINSQYLSVGDTVAPGTPVYSVAALSGREVMLGVPENVIDHLELEQQVQLQAGTVAVEGRLVGISNTLDRMTRTRALRIELPNALTLPPGQMINLKHRVTIDEVGGWLPMTAITEGNRGLWTALKLANNEDGKLIAQQAAIEILDFADDQVYVRGLLKDGDRVVAAGTHRVVPGMIVIPTDAR